MNLHSVETVIFENLKSNLEKLLRDFIVKMPYHGNLPSPSSYVAERTGHKIQDCKFT
jgi:hypothetical protein